MESEIETDQIQVPQEFVNFVNKRLERNREGGRPSFLQVLSEERNPVDEVLNILELAWFKSKSYGRIAKKYSTSYDTIYRLIRDLEPVKESLFDYLQKVPRRKHFYNEDLDTSTMKPCEPICEEPNGTGLYTTRTFSNTLQKPGKPSVTKTLEDGRETK